MGNSGDDILPTLLGVSVEYDGWSKEVLKGEDTADYILIEIRHLAHFIHDLARTRYSPLIARFLINK